MFRGRKPQMRDPVPISHRERDLLAIMRDAVTSNGRPGQDCGARYYPLSFAGFQFSGPKIGPVFSALHQVIEFASVPRERSPKRVSFGRKLAVSAAIVDPDGVVRNAHRGEQ